MLKLTQSVGDSIYVFDSEGKRILRVTYTKQAGRQISLGFDADPSITILRDKVLLNKDRDEMSEMIINSRCKPAGYVNGNKIAPNDRPIFFMEEGDENEDL